MDLIETLDWKKLKSVVDSLESEVRQSHHTAGDGPECVGCKLCGFFNKNDKPLHKIYRGLLEMILDGAELGSVLESAVRSGFVIAWNYRNTIEFEKAFTQTFTQSPQSEEEKPNASDQT